MALELHQSELQTYRRCRRRWALSSPNMLNLEIRDEPEPEALWFGSGFHFALEDFHGYQRYGGPFDAFSAYYTATQATRPENWGTLAVLAEGMLTHYQGWLSHRPNFDTLWDDGKPLVEVEWSVPIPGIDPALAVLGGTFDRLVTDEHGRVWIVDYKTASRFNTSKLDLDAQVSTYCFAFRELYGYAPEGMVYLQFLKASPETPKRLKNGSLSVDKAQHTTWQLYSEAANQVYGTDSNWPDGCLEFLTWLRDQENEDGDRFIRRDLVRRNEAQLDACGVFLQRQAEEIIALRCYSVAGAALYPNPTADCGYCRFKGLCTAMDDGSDYAALMRGVYRQREGGNTPWRQKLPSPEELPGRPPALLPPISPPAPKACSLEVPSWLAEL